MNEYDKEINIQIGKQFGMDGFVLDWVKNDFDDLVYDMNNKGILVE